MMLLKTSFLLPFLLVTQTQILATDGVFLDDNGVYHLINSGDRVLCGAMDAVTLFHFGIDASQITGTIGERSSSGSNYGGEYFDVSNFSYHLFQFYKRSCIKSSIFIVLIFCSSFTLL